MNIWLLPSLLIFLVSSCFVVLFSKRYPTNSVPHELFWPIHQVFSFVTFKVPNSFVCVCVCVWERERERERETCVHTVSTTKTLHLWSTTAKWVSGTLNHMVEEGTERPFPLKIHHPVYMYGPMILLLTCLLACSFYCNWYSYTILSFTTQNCVGFHVIDMSMNWPT